MAAARRKAGGLQWGDFPWESGAKTQRKMMGAWSPVPFIFRPKKQGVILRPNKPPGGHQALPQAGRPQKKSGCAFTPRATGAPPAACRRQHELCPGWLCAVNYGRPQRWDETQALIFFSLDSLRKSTAQFSRRIGQWIFVLRSALCLFRGLQRLDLPPAALVFRLRLRLFGS